MRKCRRFSWKKVSSYSITRFIIKVFLFWDKHDVQTTDSSWFHGIMSNWPKCKIDFKPWSIYLLQLLQTRRHFSRMPTACLTTVRTTQWTRLNMSGGLSIVRSKLNKFNMSWGNWGWIWGGGSPHNLRLTNGITGNCHMGTHLCGQNDRHMAENITFPQFRWQTVITSPFQRSHIKITVCPCFELYSF